MTPWFTTTNWWWCRNTWWCCCAQGGVAVAAAGRLLTFIVKIVFFFRFHFFFFRFISVALQSRVPKGCGTVVVSLAQFLWSLHQDCCSQLVVELLETEEVTVMYLVGEYSHRCTEWSSWPSSCDPTTKTTSPRQWWRCRRRVQVGDCDVFSWWVAVAAGVEGKIRDIFDVFKTRFVKKLLML